MGADLGDSGNNCLHLFVLHTDESPHSLSLLRSLLALGADVDEQNYSGNTPMHLAAIGRKLEVLKILFACRPDLSIRNLEGKTAEECFVDACDSANS